MNWNEILLNSILELKHKNEISQEEIDNHFYSSWEEIKYIFSPDKEKLAIHFADDITWFKSKLANCWLAYDLETVKETSNINIEYSKNYVKNNVLYKEIRLENGHIYSEITNDIFEEIKIKTQENKDRYDRDYVYKTEIETNQNKLDWLEKTYNEVKNFIDEAIYNIFKEWNTDNIKQATIYFNKLKEVEKYFCAKYNHYKVLDSDWLKQSFLKFENNKLITNEEREKEFEKIKTFYLEQIASDIEFLEKHIKSIRNSQKYYEEYKNKIFKWIFKKTNNKTINKDNKTFISNEEIFNNLSKFVEKYFKDFYIIEKNIIKLKNEEDNILNTFTINDNLEDFSIKNTYFYDLKKSSLNNDDNKKNKIEFFTDFLFYKEYNTYSKNKNITQNIKYLSVKDSVIRNNIDSLNNESITYLEKGKLNKALNSIDKNLNIEVFSDILYLSEKDSTGKNEYYYIQNENWKKLSNLRDIEVLLKSVISKINFKNKENIFEKLNNFILGNSINITWFTLTGRKNINKITGTTTSIFNLYGSNFQTYYTKFYHNTKNDIHNNISWESVNYFDINKDYLNSEFDKCIIESYQWLVKKIDDRLNLYCNTETLKIN